MSGFRRYRFSYRETIVTVLTESDDLYEFCVEAILEARSQIEGYISRNPDFLISYEPLKCENAPEIVERMCRAAKIASVGPMAAVAGTIAGYAVEKMVEKGAKIAVVDNGGDIAISTDRELLVGIYPTDFAFKVKPTDFISICTSSGRIGHSVSFGYSDASVVVGRDASVADALATALGNRIEENISRERLEMIVGDFYDEFRDYINGLLVVKDDLIALAGKLPEIVAADVDVDLITKG